MFTSFWWLFSLKLKVASDLLVYYLLCNTHSIRYIRYLLLQLSLFYILKVLCEAILLKVFLDGFCAQHKLVNLDLHSFEEPFWSKFWHCYFLLLTIVFLPRISCRFQFCLKAIIGGSVKIPSKSKFIFTIFKCLFTALFMSWWLQLYYVSISGILFHVAWFFRFSR